MNGQRFDEDMLTGSLRSLAEEMESLNAPPEIEQKLREAFRARAAATAASKKYSYYWMAAVAAVLLIAISVIALRWRDDQRQEVIAVQTQQVPIKEEPRVDQPEPPQPQEVIAQKPRRRAVRRSSSNEVANHVAREIATDFMPLGYINPAALQDGGQIVRVELPRSALLNFGMPVNMDRYHEKVKADVLLGADGLAHAIRFVQ